MKRRTFLQWLSASGAAGLSQAVLSGSGCAPEAPAPKINEKAAKDPAARGYNLVICVFDSLRGDHLGCYGYSRDTSPFVDDIARQSVVFERAYSNSSYTRESVPVIWSGLAPTRSGSMGWHARQAAGIPNLSSLFKSAGYKTALISNQPAVSGTFLHRNAAFDTVADVKAGWASRNSPKVSAEVLRLAKEWAAGPFVFYIHYLDPHTDYNPPPDMYARFANTRPAKSMTWGDIRAKYRELVKAGFGPGDPIFEDFVLRYDAEIADCDRAFGQLVAGFKEMGLLDNTIFVITSDHGEEFMEHDYLEHSWTVYEESLRIPLIFWAPSVLQPLRTASPVCSADILPTVLRLLGVSAPDAKFDGEPLFQAEKGRFALFPRKAPIISQVLIQERNVVHTIIENDWKYMSFHKWELPPDRLAATLNRKQTAAAIREGKIKPVDVFGEPIFEEIYNLTEDPGEKNNLAPDNSTKLEEQRGKLQAYLRLCKAILVKRNPTAHEQEEVSPEIEQQLQTLGYL